MLPVLNPYSLPLLKTGNEDVGTIEPEGRHDEGADSDGPGIFYKLDVTKSHIKVKSWGWGITTPYLENLQHFSYFSAGLDLSSVAKEIGQDGTSAGTAALETALDGLPPKWV